jgi:hypothetical protein
MSTDTNAPWTDAELKQMHEAFNGELTSVAPDGRLVATYDRAELRALASRYKNSHFKVDQPAAPPAGLSEEERTLRARYPSMAPAPKPASGDGDDAVLRVRYPSMFEDR